MAVGGQRDVAGGRRAGEHPLDLGGGIDAATSRAGYSRRIESRRSAPKRKTERAKQEISSPWRRVSQSTVASVPASNEPATSTTCGESPGTAACSVSCTAASEAASMPATAAAALRASVS